MSHSRQSQPGTWWGNTLTTLGLGNTSGSDVEAAVAGVDGNGNGNAHHAHGHAHAHAAEPVSVLSGTGLQSLLP